MNNSTNSDNKTAVSGAAGAGVMRTVAAWVGIPMLGPGAPIPIAWPIFPVVAVVIRLIGSAL